MRNQLYKYWALLVISWQTEFAFRTSFFIWRIRNFMASIISLTVWSVIFASNDQLFGYSRDQMITYIFIVSFLQNLIFSTQLNGLASEVYSGQLSNKLLKPINLLGFFTMQEIADKAKNVLFVLLESAILFILFKPNLIFPESYQLIFFVAAVLLGLILNFIINVLFGAIGFWSPDSWGPKFLFYMFAEYSSGRLFPLDILPTIVQKVFYVTPFPYLSYMQTQIFLGRLDDGEMLIETLVILIWTVIAGVATYKIWQRGLRDYSAAGQ